MNSQTTRTLVGAVGRTASATSSRTPQIVLRRDVDVERVATPLAHGLVRLERVVQRRVCVRYSASTTTSACREARARRRRGRACRGSPRSDSRATASSGSSSGSSTSHSTSISSSAARACAEVSRSDGRDRRALVLRLGRQHVERRPARAPRGRPARASAARGRSASRARARAGCAAPPSCEHPRQPDVGRVPRLAARALEAVDPRRRPADHVASGPAGHWSSASSSTTTHVSV